MALGSTQPFTASGTGIPVNWSVNGIQGGNATVGTITVDGIYTASASFPGLPANSVTISATSKADLTVSATAGATIVYPNDTATPQSLPIKLGTSGSNAKNVATGAAACCVGTVGSLWVRSSTSGNQFFVLSNEHVLTNSGSAATTDAINQPGPSACFAAPTGVATFAEALPVQPGTGSTLAPDNVDAAFAQIAAGAVDSSGNILDLGAAGASSIAAAPPSSTIELPSVGLSVAKSGRTTGLTCSSISSISATVTVAYDSSCGGPVAFSSTFQNQIVIDNTGNGFAAPGDSGALIVTSAQARPVGLLFAGTSTTVVANPIVDVIKALTISGVPQRIPAIVGGPDHAVSCAPTATVPSSNPNGTFTTIVPSLAPTRIAGISAVEQQRVEGVRQAHELLLTLDPSVSSVAVAASQDSPGEGALEIHVNGSLQAPIPAVIDGVRTKVIFEGSALPHGVTEQDVDHATTVKETHVQALLAQAGIQGVGVGISKDNPAEAAVTIYVVKGTIHPLIPAVLDGVRTQIVEGERFRAF